MKTIQQIREQYPQYSDLSDQKLAESLHQKHYSDMDFADFSARIGLSAPKPPSFGAQVGRQLGLAGRYAIEGPAQLLGMVTDPLAGIAGMPAGQTAEPLGSIASRFATSIGLPQPEGARERVVGDASRAIASGAPILRAGQVISAAQGPVVSGFGRMLAADPGLQATGAVTGALASGAVRESGGGQGAQTVAGILGAVTPAGSKAIASEATRRVIRGGDEGRRVMERNIRDFSTAGTTPTIGQASPSRGGKVIEARLRGAPGSVGVMSQQADTQAEDIGRRVGQLADSLSPAAGAEKGGTAIVRGITGEGGFMERFRATSGELYDTVERLLPPGTPVPAQASVSMLQRLTAPVQGAERTAKVLQNAKVASIAKAFSDDLAANNGQLPYASLKELRTEVGRLMDDSALSPDVSVRQLSQLYGAMTDDMTRAAIATGDPATIRAATRANMFYKAGQKRVEALQNALSREAGGAEAVYKAMFNNSREGGTTIRRVMQSLPEQQQKDFAAATLRRLGRANPSNQDDMGEIFSTERFLTNLNNMSPEAQSAIFDRFGPTFRSDLQGIAAATARIRDASKTAGNPAGTAQAVAQFTGYGALGLSAVQSALSLNPTAFGLVAGALATTNVAGRAFTNPRVVRWMAQTTKAPTAALPSLMAQLGRMGETDEDAAALYEELSQTVSQGSTPPQQ